MIESREQFGCRVYEWEREPCCRSFVEEYDEEDELFLEGDVLTRYLMTGPLDDMMAGRAWMR